MANEVYIERETGTTYRVDLAPVHLIEDTYVKSPEIESLETDPSDGEDPITGVYDTKKTLHRFVITGVLTALDGVSVAVRKTYLKYLYGYGNVTDTRLKFYDNGEVYFVYMTRLTMNRAGGENFYEYIIELVEGTDYDNI